MGASWFIQPAIRRLSLSDDQWILVKQRLTAGEYRAHLKRSSTVGVDGARRLDSLDHGLSLVVAYLLDWSLVDAPVRGAAESDLIAVLDNLDQDRFVEIKAAIEKHEVAMDAEREDAKKKATTSGADPISPSPSAAVGVLSGSETLM